jgi:hypothetical protein
MGRAVGRVDDRRERVGRLKEPGASVDLTGDREVSADHGNAT